ncbi:TetR family transcriptional regulator [Thermosporothrix hazakensis]|jgi:AcrR family transcriptional regulator|uniref:TetR family transcriptional regulator n=2 Tax=Thermosporothrix TaxID=768650 RepID=A0A326UCD5_THEHA|nr:TetR/AcrR family transcriptional regulator [Thermosporothrix hazakensis]PZW34319.1 TetR family transcriptional regulator [Thermosporothrix hazakensis]BBH85439.1 hypothetical protein KTC_01900 [Thermosporothrix sp. COM3]GCE46129.1 hypothetical protein KTH_09980 [Thermosporothrix hazakensis]
MAPRVPRQARSRAKFHQILEAALELFREHGYTETTVDAIVQRSGVSVGVFYSYFASKQQVLLALFEQERDTQENTIFSLPKEKLTVEKTEALIWKTLHQRSGLQRVRQELRLINPEFDQNERELVQRRYERLKRDLEVSQKAGLIRQDIRCETCAWVLMSIIAHLVDALVERSEEECKEDVHAASLLICHMLHEDEDVH